MMKHARELFYLSMALFFVVLSVLAVLAYQTVLGNKGMWVSQVTLRILEKRAKNNLEGKHVVEKIADRLLANDGKLAVAILKQLSQRKGSDAKPKGVPLILDKAVDKLLANKGALLAHILAKAIPRRKNRRPPVDKIINRLLANNGALLTRILVKALKPPRPKGKRVPLAQLLLKQPQALGKVLAAVVKELGLSGLVSTLRAKVGAIQTRVSLKQEIRNALRQLPALLAGMMERRRQRRLLNNKAWRKIKSQFPKIRAQLKGAKCFMLMNLRRAKNNQIRARIRVKMLKPGCAKLPCHRHTQIVDQAITRWTRAYGVHEGHIQIRFNLARRRCNTNL